MGLCSGGPIIGSIFASEIWGAGRIFGRANFSFFLGGMEGLLTEFYGIVKPHCGGILLTLVVPRMIREAVS